MTTTILENIIFGEKFDKEKLKRALKMAQFHEDISIFEKGVYTVCAELGMNLSGGQKARLSLARTFYQNRDIMVMDDPLRALDAKLTRKILKKSIVKKLNEKTRIMTSNDPNDAKHADRVIILKDGFIAYNGEYRREEIEKYFSTEYLEKKKAVLLPKSKLSIIFSNPFNRKIS